MGTHICGLFGGVGQAVNPGIIRSLAMLNRERGYMSTGLFDFGGGFYKDAVSATEFLKQEQAAEFIAKAAKSGACCGHTRAASHGKVCVKNAHPFNYGDVTGAHNGTINVPKELESEYTVDTQYAIDRLSKGPAGDYQEALKGMVGWYVLTWKDLRTGFIYLLNHAGELCFNITNRTMYYSSEELHLFMATGKKALHKLEHGHVWRFTPKSMERLDDFTGGKSWAEARAVWAAGVQSQGIQQKRHYDSNIWDGFDEEECLPVDEVEWAVEHEGLTMVKCKDDVWRSLTDSDVVRAKAAAEKKQKAAAKQAADTDVIVLPGTVLAKAVEEALANVEQMDEDLLANEVKKTVDEMQKSGYTHMAIESTIKQKYPHFKGSVKPCA